MSHETTAVMSCYLAHESRSNTACHRFNSHVTAVAVVDSVPVVSVTCVRAPRACEREY